MQSKILSSTQTRLTLEDLLQRNKEWVTKINKENPSFFENLSKGQKPKFFFLGCVDSRKSLNFITQTDLGQLLIQRNIANQANPEDKSIQASIEFALFLEVNHIVVCGHTQCGGVALAHTCATQPPTDSLKEVKEWVRPIVKEFQDHSNEFDNLKTDDEKLTHLSKLNCLAQLKNICQTPAMQKAFESRKYPELHAWIFVMETGLIESLELPVTQWKAEGILPQSYPN